ncbi:MAG: hypothetical protein KBC81_02715 [Candidatus Pacebacteria bacterium]|nr:hypothetical protein [Candidatus Paceibacterota bacterium]
MKKKKPKKRGAEKASENVSFNRLEPRDIFKVIKDKAPVERKEAKGIFFRLEKRSLQAMGLGGSSHEDEVISFDPMFTIVRKIGSL